MKTKLFWGITLGIATVVAVYVTVSSTNNSSEMSDLMIKNLEALTSSEGEAKIPCSAEKKSKCTFTYEDADRVQKSATWKNYKKI